MIPYQHQVELAEQGLAILKKHMILYLAMEERTGKTLTAILIAEQTSISNVLVITKKKALKGWTDTLANYYHTKNYTVTNYHQANKLTKQYDLVILDEAHNYISAYPKVGKLWREVKRIVYDSPIIYLSATPHAQGYQQLYHQFKLSAWSPWLKFLNFYRWFDIYGKKYTLEINGINVPQYDRCHEEKVMADVQHLFIVKSRQELGFEHEPEDEVHYIDLEARTKVVYNELLKHNIVELSVGELVCDSNAKLRTSLHQLEGGTIKIGEARHVLANNEKVNFIKQKFGDSKDLVIMYNYQAELIKLEQSFKHATILQATSNAEGVDLSGFKHLVIYSQDFSTARHTQRRARQANKQRKTPIQVHYLLVKKAISEQCYKTVSLNKKNFVDSVFKKETL